MRDRAYRRHQWQRAKSRAARYVRDRLNIDPELSEVVKRINDHKVIRFAVDRTPCSCAMCGNPRRHFGHVTRHEQLTPEVDTELTGL